VSFNATTTAIVARLNLAPPPPPPPNVAPLQNAGAPSTQWRTSARTVSQSLSRVDTAPAAGNTTAAITPASWGTVGGQGTPVTDSQGAMTLASVPPTVRTLAKVLPFVAAVFFWQKGDRVLAGVSAAAGGLAVVML